MLSILYGNETYFLYVKTNLNNIANDIVFSFDMESYGIFYRLFGTESNKIFVYHYFGTNKATHKIATIIYIQKEFF